jgi:hypothetical protein
VQGLSGARRERTLTRAAHAPPEAPARGARTISTHPRISRMQARRPASSLLRQPLRAAAGALLLGASVPAAAAAQQFLPLSSYTFSGCFEGLGCHTARVVVGDADPTLNFRGVDPTLKGMLFGISHELPAGVALSTLGANPFPYDIVSATGTRQIWDDDDIYRGGPTCPSVTYPTSTRTCTGGYGLMPGVTVGTPFSTTSLAGWVSPDWSPTAFSLRLRLGTPGAFVQSGDELRTVLLPLVTPVSTVPEPTTIALVGGGLAMLGLGSWRRRRAAR